MNRNVLKMIAAISMLMDHLGAEVFPQYPFLRVLGRLAFPVFSYFVYEGCLYTRNRRKYLSRMLMIGVLCLVIYKVFSGEIYWNILFTLTLSAVNLFALWEFLKSLKGKGEGTENKEMSPVLAGAVFALCVTGTWLLIRYVTVDYGFFGVMLPVWMGVFDAIFTKTKALSQVWQHLEGKIWKQLEWQIPRLIGFTIGVLLLAYFTKNGLNLYPSLLAVPVLALYNGERGDKRWNTFFYLYYPLHFLIVEAINQLVH